MALHWGLLGSHLGAPYEPSILRTAVCWNFPLLVAVGTVHGDLPTSITSGQGLLLLHPLVSSVSALAVALTTVIVYVSRSWIRKKRSVWSCTCCRHLTSPFSL